MRVELLDGTGACSLYLTANTATSTTWEYCSKGVLIEFLSHHSTFLSTLLTRSSSTLCRDSGLLLLEDRSDLVVFDGAMSAEALDKTCMRTRKVGWMKCE